MTKTIVWGFREAIFNELKKHLDITHWFSDQVSSIDMWDFIQKRPPVVTPNIDSTQAYKDFHEKYFYQYLVLAMRRGLEYSDHHELENEFSLNFHYFYQLLTQSKTELIIFSNLPHEGSDFILYQVAKLLNIKTLMCYQTLFKNAFLPTTNLEDFGKFKSIPQAEVPIEIPISPGYQENVFYMNTANSDKSKAGQLAQKISSLINQLLHHPLSNMKKLIKRMVVNDKREQAYKENLAKYSIGQHKLVEISKNKRCIYFPLHLQPELTTATLGGIYQDQIYTIEKLRQHFDSDWAILVKENPKQSYFQRNPLFFERLNSLENTYLVNIETPSYELMDISDFVATITGTAGWEAIKGGKKCLYFGQAWYGELENTYQYSEDFDIKEFLTYLDKEITFDVFKDSFEKLASKARPGVTDPDYEVLFEAFDQQQNAQTTVNSFMDIINNPNTKW